MPLKSNKSSKISTQQRGPYRIIKTQSSGVDYDIKLIGSRNKRDQLKVHGDRIRRLRGWDSIELSAAPGSKKEVASSEKEYVVEQIRGQRQAEGQTGYLIKWEGFIEHRWEPAANMVHCPEKVEQWMKLTAGKKQSLMTKATRGGIIAAIGDLEEAEEWMNTCNTMSEEEMMQMDLSKCSRKKMLQQICEAAGIRLEEVAVVLAGPPCETYSPAEARNISRGNEYRDHKDPQKGPRLWKSVRSEADRLKRKRAAHDAMIKNMIESICAGKEEQGFDIVVENLVGSLRKRPFMRTEKWERITNLETVDYCAYGVEVRKSTKLWTTLMGWKPRGNTGNGRCKCKAHI